MAINKVSDPPVAIRDRTRAFALRIIRLAEAVPRSFVGRHLADQLLRSGTSIGAHYREASRARTTAEFVSKLNIAAQELDEAMYWMELIADSSLLPQPRLGMILNEANQLLAIIVSMMLSAKRKGVRT